MTKEELEKKYLIMKENAETLAKLLDKEQKKNKKAIEYIENDKKDKCMEDFKTGIMTRELKILEILKGDDKE